MKSPVRFLEISSNFKLKLFFNPSSRIFREDDRILLESPDIESSTIDELIEKASLNCLMHGESFDKQPRIDKTFKVLEF